MIIVLKKGATGKEINHILRRIKKLGLKPMVSKGVERTIIGVIGEEDILRSQPLSALPGVEKVMPVLAPYKLVSREFKKEDTVIKIKNVEIGTNRIVVMAGPCAVENKKMLQETARKVMASGAAVLRGGAFKPRTSPYSFQGLGEKGLKYLREVADEVGLLVVTEVMDARDLALVSRYADILQIGARNMANFSLLKAAGKAKMPVLLKRGMMSTVKELLMSAEYLLSRGNFKVILCERGIRTFEDSTRNTPDIAAIPVIKELSHLPVIFDPSHSTGRWDLVRPTSRAAIAAGADGLLVEVHPHPDEALSDGAQSLKPEKFTEMMAELKRLAKSLGRKL